MEVEPKPKETPLKSPSHGTLIERNELAHAAITIGKSPVEVFAFWRDFENLPKFMKDLSSVRVLDSRTSEWTVNLKSGKSACWIAKIVAEGPGEMIAWQSVEGSEVETKGKVWFRRAPAGRGTVVELTLDYRIPGGKLAELITFLTGESPGVLMRTNLRRLKAVLETGEYPTTVGQPSGREELLPVDRLH